MAMTDAGMSNAIKSAIIAEKGPADDDGRLQEMCDAIGTAIVEYIKANAEVLPGTFATGSSGGPVSGIGTIT